MALSNAEKQKRYRERKAGGGKPPMSIKEVAQVVLDLVTGDAPVHPSDLKRIAQRETSEEERRELWKEVGGILIGSVLVGSATQREAEASLQELIAMSREAIADAVKDNPSWPA